MPERRVGATAAADSGDARARRVASLANTYRPRRGADTTESTEAGTQQGRADRTANGMPRAPRAEARCKHLRAQGAVQPVMRNHFPTPCGTLCPPSRPAAGPPTSENTSPSPHSQADLVEGAEPVDHRRHAGRLLPRLVEHGGDRGLSLSGAGSLQARPRQENLGSHKSLEHMKRMESPKPVGGRL